MLQHEIKLSLTHALEQLEQAKLELNRPSEDVVTVSVCMASKEAVGSLLKAFLVYKGVAFTAQQSLNDLLNLCKKSESKFNSIDLSELYCTHLSSTECKGKYCMPLENVQHCFSVVDTVKQLVFTQMNLKENELV